MPTKPTHEELVEKVQEPKKEFTLGKRLKMEEELRQLEHMVMSIKNLIALVDQNYYFIYVNKAYCEALQKAPRDIIGHTVANVFGREMFDSVLKSQYDRCVEGKNVNLQTWYDFPGWGRRYMDVNYYPYFEKEGNVLAVAVNAHDITEIKQSEQKLQNAYNEIKRLKHNLEQENIYLREEIEIKYRHDDIVGESSVIKSVLSQAEKVAGQATSVLILGETGTGKELLARAIHKMSPRHKRQMITVNCGALPGALIESELFGREKGAFTGAVSKESGRFEVADGSTIFLDEIGDLPVELQSKLLRVLEEGRFERLGSSKIITVDVRVIAATHHNLKALVREGRFRKDLFYRLGTFPITLPPLCERSEDIPLLVWAFVKEFSESMGKKIRMVSKRTMSLLQNYPWPGNVRELKNVIERAIILSTGATLRINRLGAEDEVSMQSMALKQVEKEHILKVLENTGWKVSGKNGAAEILGLKPTTLEARMKKLSIYRPH